MFIVRTDHGSLTLPRYRRILIWRVENPHMPRDVLFLCRPLIVWTPYYSRFTGVPHSFRTGTGARMEGGNSRNYGHQPYVKTSWLAFVYSIWNPSYIHRGHAGSFFNFRACVSVTAGFVMFAGPRNLFIFKLEVLDRVFPVDGQYTVSTAWCVDVMISFSFLINVPEDSLVYTRTHTSLVYTRTHTLVHYVCFALKAKTARE